MRIKSKTNDLIKSGLSAFAQPLGSPVWVKCGHWSGGGESCTSFRDEAMGVQMDKCGTSRGDTFGYFIDGVDREFNTEAEMLLYLATDREK